MRIGCTHTMRTSPVNGSVCGGLGAKLIFVCALEACLLWSGGLASEMKMVF